jgi:hypothetical protein
MIHLIIHPSVETDTHQVKADHGEELTVMLVRIVWTGYEASKQLTYLCKDCNERHPKWFLEGYGFN